MIIQHCNNWMNVDPEQGFKKFIHFMEECLKEDNIQDLQFFMEYMRKERNFYISNNIQEYANVN